MTVVPWPCWFSATEQKSSYLPFRGCSSAKSGLHFDCNQMFQRRRRRQGDLTPCHFWTYVAGTCSGCGIKKHSNCYEWCVAKCIESLTWMLPWAGSEMLWMLCSQKCVCLFRNVPVIRFSCRKMHKKISRGWLPLKKSALSVKPIVVDVFWIIALSGLYSVGTGTNILFFFLIQIFLHKFGFMFAF